MVLIFLLGIISCNKNKAHLGAGSTISTKVNSEGVETYTFHNDGTVFNRGIGIMLDNIYQMQSELDNGVNKAGPNRVYIIPRASKQAEVI